jgi:hypothetical protein
MCFTWVSSNLNHKYKAVVNVKKILRPYFTDFRNKLEYLTMVGLFSLVLGLLVSLASARVKHLSGAPQ